MASIPHFKLNSGYSIPSVGMGCWQGQPGAGVDNELVDALGVAFKTGYRHLDTANMYQNEREVGEAVRKSGIPREEIFVTTKLSPKRFHDVVGGFEQSLKDLNVDYIDLYLMHWPHGIREDGKVYGFEESDLGPTYNETWAQFEKLLETHKGKIRSIGVSNFSPRNLNKLLKTAKVVPAVNQIEASPYIPDEELVELCAEHGIHVTAYTPLGAGNSPLLKDPDLTKIAEAHNATVGQVALSWAVQRGTSVAPKSTNPERMKQNITLIKLTDAEMEQISNIHRKDPSRSTRLNVAACSNGLVAGCTLEQLGWDVGFTVGGHHIVPKSRDPAAASGKGVPPAINAFVKQFYAISDTPDVHQQYTEQFVDDQERLSFQIGPMDVAKTRADILAWRQRGWQGVTRRHHVVNGIFISPEHEDEIMLDGTVEMDKDGNTLKFNWAGRMVFDQDSLERGQPLIEAYKVWLSPN